MIRGTLEVKQEIVFYTYYATTANEIVVNNIYRCTYKIAMCNVISYMYEIQK